MNLIHGKPAKSKTCRQEASRSQRYPCPAISGRAKAGWRQGSDPIGDDVLWSTGRILFFCFFYIYLLSLEENKQTNKQTNKQNSFSLGTSENRNLLISFLHFFSVFFFYASRCFVWSGKRNSSIPIGRWNRKNNAFDPFLSRSKEKLKLICITFVL